MDISDRSIVLVEEIILYFHSFLLFSSLSCIIKKFSLPSFSIKLHGYIKYDSRGRKRERNENMIGSEYENIRKR